MAPHPPGNEYQQIFFPGSVKEKLKCFENSYNQSTKVYLKAPILPEHRQGTLLFLTGVRPFQSVDP